MKKEKITLKESKSKEEYMGGCGGRKEKREKLQKYYNHKKFSNTTQSIEHLIMTTKSIQVIKARVEIVSGVPLWLVSVGYGQQPGLKS